VLPLLDEPFPVAAGAGSSLNSQGLNLGDLTKL
jgi:hypothetical protein